MRQWFGSIGLALAIGTVQAAEPASAPSAPSQYQWPGYEVTPFLGFDIGGSFRLDEADGTGIRGSAADARRNVNLDDRASFALALDLRADDAAQYELFYAREGSTLHGNPAFSGADIVVEYLHLGGLVLLDDEAWLKPYVDGGVGITRFSPQAPGNADTRFSASAGLGLRVPVSRHFSLRLEARGFVTLVNADSAIFCQSDQSGLLCRIRGRGQTFFQGQVLAGAAFMF
ncbi:MAG: outer membrane protein [Steroidobacteraceae bacterium]